MNNSTCWIVTANAGVARIFSQTGNGNLEGIHDMGNEDAQLVASDIESDQIGQRAASKSKHSVGAPTQPSGYQPHQSPEEHRTELFAREIINYLLRGHDDQKFQKLILISSPEFLGQLRKLLDARLAALVTLEINKDYTHIKIAELRKHIEAYQKKEKSLLEE